MIAGLLLRLGLGALIPYLLPIALGLLLGGGGVTAWWFEWFDVWSTTIIIAGAALIYLYAATNSQIGRLVIVAALVGLGYLKGTHDETLRTDDKIAAAEAAIHAAYKARSDEEVARQDAINKEAATAAAKKEAERLAEIKDLRGQLQAVRQEADRDKNAERPALGIDSIDRVNRVRGHAAERVRSRRPKT